MKKITVLKNQHTILDDFHHISVALMMIFIMGSDTEAQCLSTKEFSSDDFYCKIFIHLSKKITLDNDIHQAPF